MSVIEKINNRLQWLDFLLYKQNNGSLTKDEEKALVEFIENKRYLYYLKTSLCSFFLYKKEKNE